MSLDVWTEWIVSNAPTFRSIGEQIDFFKEVRTKSARWDQISKLHDIAQLGLENMETVRKEQWTPNGMIETASAKFVREKLGWGLDRAKLVNNATNIEFWLETISEVASLSWGMFNNIETEINKQSMLSGPVNLTGPNMVEERAWGLGKFMTSMEMPSKEIPFVKVDLNAPPHILGKLESFRKDMRQSTYNANNWSVLAKKFGFDHPFFGKYFNEEPFKYDPDFGYRALGKEVTLSNIFDNFLADKHPNRKDTDMRTDKGANYGLIARDKTFKIEAARRVLADRYRAQQQQPWPGGQHYPLAIDNSATRDVFSQERLAEPKKEEEMECLKHEDSVKVGWPEGKIEVKKAEDETKPYVPFRAEGYKASIPKVEDVGGGLQERRPNWETWGNEIVLEEADDPVQQIPSLYEDKMEEEF
ncbi:hypothetical protein TWF103_010667 [Orbilia oligospora]|uniref:Uncharacterized protein n=2 Tax=Orbilia oligospora TaxID=2813651 RepID=A0A7C8K8H6_ORBOL|nr:hypothetical protein TWF103_010667 [Orbilia oligospora]KAF3146100.1 hypothetical protein TWF703_005646 [Orbilia oligospora]